MRPHTSSRGRGMDGDKGRGKIGVRKEGRVSKEREKGEWEAAHP